jgi:hypothetical protein
VSSGEAAGVLEDRLYEFPTRLVDVGFERQSERFTNHRRRSLATDTTVMSSSA